MKLPYSDNEMRYDMTSHRYVLTETGVANGLNLVLQNELNMSGSMNAANEINSFLDEVSEDIYEYIYLHSSNRMLTEYLLAKKPQYREVIKSAMIKQVKYMRLNGNIGDQSGLDFLNGRYMEYDQIDGRRISMRARTVLANAGLLYTGQLMSYKNIRFREDY